MELTLLTFEALAVQLAGLVEQQATLATMSQTQPTAGAQRDRRGFLDSFFDNGGYHPDDGLPESLPKKRTVACQWSGRPTGRKTNGDCC